MEVFTFSPPKISTPQTVLYQMHDVRLLETSHGPDDRESHA